MSSHPLRLLVVAPYDLSRSGGVNNQVRAQAAALRRLGHTVRVCGPASAALDDGEVPLGRPVRVNFFGTESGLGLDPRGAGALGRLLKEPIDLVHVHEPFTPLMPWMALACAQAPVVGTFHVHREQGHRVYAWSSWLLRPLARRIARRIAVSEAARRTVAAHFPGRYDIVPNGIDFERFNSPGRPPALFEAGRPHVLYVGRLEPRKGVEFLVRAMADVQRRVPAVRLIVGGTGPDRDPLARLAAALGVDVRFAGAIPESELPAYFQASDVVCSPAIGDESFGIVLLEAMASGRPVVASRIDGYAELVNGRECARLVPPSDAAALAGEISDLLGNAAARAQLSAAGREVARDYDWSTIAMRIMEIYQSALAAPVRP
jgi:phosphatidyl-myo-inositol alpha-mannosyltransferase